jgi:hypothetical protein
MMLRRCDEMEDYECQHRRPSEKGKSYGSDNEASGWVKHVAQGRPCWTSKVLSSHDGGRMLMMEGNTRVRKDVMKTWSE